MGVFDSVVHRRSLDGEREEIVFTLRKLSKFDDSSVEAVKAEFVRQYVEKNYDELVKMIDFEALKAQLTLLLAQQFEAQQKARAAGMAETVGDGAISESHVANPDGRFSLYKGPHCSSHAFHVGSCVACVAEGHNHG